MDDSYDWPFNLLMIARMEIHCLRETNRDHNPSPVDEVKMASHFHRRSGATPGLLGCPSHLQRTEFRLVGSLFEVALFAHKAEGMFHVVCIEQSAVDGLIPPASTDGLRRRKRGVSAGEVAVYGQISLLWRVFLLGQLPLHSQRAFCFLTSRQLFSATGCRLAAFVVGL